MILDAVDATDFEVCFEFPPRLATETTAIDANRVTRIHGAGPTWIHPVGISRIDRAGRVAGIDPNRLDEHAITIFLNRH